MNPHHERHPAKARRSGFGSYGPTARLEPVPLGALQRGVVVWASVAFRDDPTQHEIPPFVVDHVEGRRVFGHKVSTSRQRHTRPWNIELHGLDAAGLTR